MSDLEGYIASVVDDVETRRADPHGTAAGQYEGIFVEGKARLHPLPGETEKYHGGYLIGHLVRWLATHGRPLDETILGPTLYAAGIAHREAQEGLAKEDGVLRAHLYAAGMAERKIAGPLSVRDERMVFGWLCELAGVPLTTKLVGRLERLRVKRHERYGTVS